MTQFAMVFPGQGSQSVGMLGAYADHDLVRKHFQLASEVLGYDLLDLVLFGPEDRLNNTLYAQPALLVASVAFFALWIDAGLEKPVVMAGHSLGEFSALVCSGALTFSDALQLVSVRARSMADSGQNRAGAMTAIIGLSDEVVTQLCQTISNNNVDSVVVPANFNSPGQVVISGDESAVSQVEDQARVSGAKMVVRLPVSVASHSPLMHDAARKFQSAVDTTAIQVPSVPVIHNVDAQVHQDVKSIRSALVGQLTCSVRWVASVEKMVAWPVADVVECGPGAVLKRLVSRINRSIKAATFEQAFSARLLVEK